MQDKGVRFVTWDGWMKVDAEEQMQGAAHGRPRVKITEKSQMLQTAGILT